MISINVRICTKCDIPHVENCPKCFGYGFYHNGVPIPAGEAREAQDGDFVICFECYGEPTNESIFDFWGDPNSPPPTGVIHP